MHRPWFPPDLDAAPQARMNAYLYHLSMIDRRDREMRYEKFRAIDPRNEHQAIGYQHLIDERNLTLKPVRPWRRYTDLGTGTARGRSDMPDGATGASALPDRALFDESLYLALNPDVRRDVAKGDLNSGWDHFERHGAREGRNWRSRPNFTGLDFGAIFRGWREAKS
ncbi:hypothetical protein [Kaistia terrae]|uniref:Uncharacterized protein n=1 Tax=Kaistia terrae TaxID=537017 RepID=A0ABW0PZP2_9HYPH|nr:hypothetical protein [Kaistia terrae]MCX5578973.1 hypothetical protein [Kaistia terrae]